MIDQQEELEQLLATELYERGEKVYEWPADEAEAYRELRWAEGHAAARKIMFEKAAKVVIARGFVKTTLPTREEVARTFLLAYHGVDIFPELRDDGELAPLTNSLRAADAVLHSLGEAVKVPEGELPHADILGEAWKRLAKARDSRPPRSVVRPLEGDLALIEKLMFALEGLAYHFVTPPSEEGTS